MSLGRALALFGLTLGLAAPASAQTSVHVSLSGRGAAAARTRVVDAIEAAEGLSLTDDAGSADATVEGQMQRASRRRWRAQLRVTDGSGNVVATETLTAGRQASLARQVGRWARRQLVPALQMLPAAAAEPPPPEREAEPEATDPAPAPTPAPDASSDEGTTRSAPAPLRFELGAALTHRRLSYRDDIFAELRPYELPVWPLVQLGVEFFPGHLTPDMDGLWGLSVYANAQFAAGLSSRTGNGASFPTTAWGLGIGARYRVFVDEVTLLGDLSYQTLSFGISDADELTPRPAIPSVEYHALRAGLGFQWDIGFGFFFLGSAGLALPLSSGEILGEDWFPNGGAGGVDSDIGLGQRVDDFEFRARFAYRRFYFWFNSEPGDARVAGGALDEWFSAVLDIAFTPS